MGVAFVVTDLNAIGFRKTMSPIQKLREAFIETNMSNDEDLPAWITAAVKHYCHPIHGIFTLGHNYVVATAAAAEHLGFPTCPSAAFQVACDKHQSRKLVALPHEHFTVDRNKDYWAAREGTNFQPQSPMIAKPRIGRLNSHYISKAIDKDEL